MGLQQLSNDQKNHHLMTLKYGKAGGDYCVVKAAAQHQSKNEEIKMSFLLNPCFHGRRRAIT